MLLKKIYRVIKNKKLLIKTHYRDITILCYPKINTEDDYLRELSRILWYGHPFYEKINKIIFLINPSLLKYTSDFKVPFFVDTTVMSFFESMKNKIEFITDEKVLKGQQIDIVVKWQNIQDLSQLGLRFPYVVNASVAENQFEANQMVKISEVFLKQAVKSDNNTNLVLLLKKFQNTKYKSVTLFGSGPSLKNYKDFDYRNNLSIVCNSIVKNKELLKFLRPEIIVATDAVFHSGYSTYAAEFREALCEALDLVQEMVFIVPLRDLMLYKYNLPEKYQARIYGLEGKTLGEFNLDLIKNPCVKSTSNVLTFFMIPLASTISKNINIIGFDGKNISVKNKFWNYDEKSQFVDSIDYTKAAHPAFYRVDYDQYYTIHCSEVEKIIQSLKKNEINCKLLTTSNIPALEQLK